MKYKNIVIHNYWQLLDEFIAYVKQADNNWTIEYDRDSKDITFRKFSPYGQDFAFTVDIGEGMYDIQYNVYLYYNSFDCSEEAYIWLDSSGHGKNGAPYDMKDVYEDIKVCEQYIDDMYDIISDFREDIEEEL